MGLAELLAGCPRADTPVNKQLRWQSIQAFPGFVIARMLALLTRPKFAIGEFGAKDYLVPLSFFLIFTFILTILQNIASDLQLAVEFTSSQPAYTHPGISDVLTMFFSFSASSQQYFFWPFERTIIAFLLMGVSVIILALGLWLITGVISWNPAFTISAYCLPVPMLLFTLLAFVQVPGVIPAAFSNGTGLVFTLAGIIYTVVIAGYGIRALTKTPILTAIIVALIWTVLGMLVIGGALEFVVLPLESGLRNMIALTLFPQSFLTNTHQ